MLCAWSQNWKKESFLGGACDPLNLLVTEEMAASVCASLSMPLFLLGYTTWATRWQERPLWDTKGWSVPVRKEQVRQRQRCLWNQGAESWWVRAVSGNSCRVKLVDFCLEGKRRKIRAMKSSSSRQELFVTVKYKVDSSSLSPHLLCFHCLGVYFSTGYTDSSWEGEVWAEWQVPGHNPWKMTEAIVLEVGSRGWGGCFPSLMGVWAEERRGKEV